MGKTEEVSHPEKLREVCYFSVNGRKFGLQQREEKREERSTTHVKMGFGIRGHTQESPGEEGREIILVRGCSRTHPTQQGRFGPSSENSLREASYYGDKYGMG